MEQCYISEATELQWLYKKMNKHKLPDWYGLILTV